MINMKVMSFFIEGDANENDVLKEAGIERAQYHIVALPDDAANLFMVMSTRQLKKTFILSAGHPM